MSNRVRGRKVPRLREANERRPHRRQLVRGYWQRERMVAAIDEMLAEDDDVEMIDAPDPDTTIDGAPFVTG